ncbi:XRE family transcriptional regulator [Halalkalibacterium halodurans]|uniref:helix-turn-helix domain-containing protein n=1 Tax=Halalkalibacterium halodurans TaxID=86665 RepID=UPI002AAA08C7|nr:XRE family transcriptional regulator [Halalkalibacterium halodurans]MDY7223461.1 XRE family transcriptional regulator [Halalkalibacterium halodurans]MDY7242682.1 XRE family transcriptional regulator [Halalkalibacterium halodurans]MED4081611.1 XRE family transcriptional regulator [Halalkalibacterium halodurans]MED4084977.1 XRE family transcriptional regulator [Halalkalibacterium halodurans]MED4104136.1 XRE family transcriptional regulator [Halalkalibacterium halodurans]
MNKEMLSKRIGQRLKRIRSDRGMTLDQLAKKTGVSKPMLGQIERGESNPTVSTLWKIATGLHVSFTAFIEDEKPNVTVIKRDQVLPIIDGCDFQVFPLFPRSKDKPFEIFSVKLEAGTDHTSEGHAQGVHEFVIVEKGTLNVKIGDEVYVLERGDGIHFPADQEHHYINGSSSEACVFTNIISYEWTGL